MVSEVPRYKEDGIYAALRQVSEVQGSGLVKVNPPSGVLYGRQVGERGQSEYWVIKRGMSTDYNL
jgi:hypothetical protein